MKTMLIEKVSTYGIVSGDKFYSVYDAVNTPAKLKVGMLIEAELKTSKKGVEYINKLTIKGDAPKTEAPKPAPVTVKKETPKAEAAKPVVRPEPKARDFDAEARGKTRCAMFEAALQSPVVAQLCLTVNGLDAALEMVKKAADQGFAYVFPEEK